MTSRPLSNTFSFGDAEMPVSFGRYMLIKRRTSDAISDEFLALWGVNEGIDQLRSVRCIFPSVADESQFVALFSEESRSLSRLSSTNVVRIMEVGMDSGIPFVAREHVEGGSLERLIELSGDRKMPCPWELAAHIVSEVLRGLDYVHRRENLHGQPMGMRHGDIRPANVLLSFNGEVKLTNFGSSLYFIVDEKTNAKMQTFRGGYALPEAATLDEASMAGDLWGAGVILWALLAGKAPSASTSDGIPWRPTALANRVEEMPSDMDMFLAKALNPDADYRFEDAASMRDALLQIIGQNAKGHPPDDLAIWVRELGQKDKAEEEKLIRVMFGQEAQMTLDGDTASVTGMGPGTTLDGRYHLQRQLGEGGMGMVYEAEHLGLERKVAVKVLHERVLDDEVALERFRREAKITGALGHPNIIGVSDFGVTDDGHHYLVMDLLKGESLADRIKKGAIPARELADLSAQICDGLEVAHQAGVVHRDLKPENIFLTENGPCILDFGIAKRTGLDEEEHALTQTGHICGTVEYLSPEQVRGMEPDLRSDIYAVGIIIYEALTGTTPFRGRTVGETLHKVMNDKLVAPRKRIDDHTIPSELETVCLKAVSRKAERRYNTAADMAKALRVLLSKEEEGKTGFFKNNLIKWLMAAGIVSLCVIAAVFIAISSSNAENRSGSEINNKTVQKENKTPVQNEALNPVVQIKDPPPTKPIVELNESTVPEADTAPRQPDGGPDRVKELLFKAEKELKKGSFGKAAKYYDEALRLDPRIAKAWFGKGKAAYEQGQVSKAISYVKKALQKSPGKCQWRIYLGKIRMSENRTEAIKEWKRVQDTKRCGKEATQLLNSVGE